MAPSEEVISAAKARFAEEGWCVIPHILSPEKIREIRERVWKAKETSEANGEKTYLEWLDPNSSNIRIFYLLELDPVFRELISHPISIEMAKNALGDNFQISNFTANIAMPGSESMGLHSDTSLQCPDPWLNIWGVNVAWALQDTYFENGSTLYIPGSHKWTKKEDVPQDYKHLLVPTEIPAGGVLVMDGRLWHTSGRNITTDNERIMLFGAFNAPFLRSQVNWTAGLSDTTKATLSDEMKEWLGLNRDGNLGVVKSVNAVF